MPTRKTRSILTTAGLVAPLVPIGYFAAGWLATARANDTPIECQATCRHEAGPIYACAFDHNGRRPMLVYAGEGGRSPAGFEALCFEPENESECQIIDMLVSAVRTLAEPQIRRQPARSAVRNAANQPRETLGRVNIARVLRACVRVRARVMRYARVTLGRDSHI